MGRPVPASRVAGTGPSVPGSGPGSEALGKRVFAGQEAKRDRYLTPARYAQFLPQDVAVRLRRSRRDPEPRADFLVGAPGCDQLYDLPLPLRQPGRDLRQDLVHGGDASNAKAM